MGPGVSPTPLAELLRDPFITIRLALERTMMASFPSLRKLDHCSAIGSARIENHRMSRNVLSMRVFGGGNCF